MLRFGNDASLAAPTVLRAVLEILEDAHGLSRLFEFLVRLLQFLFNLTNHYIVLRQSDDIIHAVAFAPRQDFFTAKSGISS